MQQSKIPALVLAGVILSGCSTYGGTSTSANTVISVQYGVVQQIQQTELDASAPKGALLGGLLGLAVAAGTGGSTGAQVGGAAAGALVGGLIQEQRKANNKAEQYTIKLNSGATVAIVTVNNDIQIGDCVSVEQGNQANIRRVSPVMCNSVTGTTHPAYQQLHNEDVNEAQQCDQAKQEVLNATTQQAVDVANAKMRALCES